MLWRCREDYDNSEESGESSVVTIDNPVTLHDGIDNDDPEIIGIYRIFHQQWSQVIQFQFNEVDQSINLHNKYKITSI